MKGTGLAPHTGKIFEGISKLDCIKPFVLVGGTALSLQLNNRQSEDLDFKTLISSALEHFGHRLKSKGLMAMLTNDDLFKKDEHFEQLSPMYDITANEIQEYIKAQLSAAHNDKL